MDESRILQCVSYGLYKIVNAFVGPEREIQIRRTVTNLANDFETQYSILADNPMFPHLSGSYAEGFRFRSSDQDTMFVMRHVIVTNNQEHDSYSDNITVLRMETDLCRPGFSLLRLDHASLSGGPFVILSCVQLPRGVYVSSSLWKEVNPKVIPNGVIHGPCDSGMVGNVEVDFAYCLRCDTWPESALSCINRLKRVGWPSSSVLNNILKEGCHIVAIGAKDSHFENEEWRISFSFAEKTLIHNMNHCQFLCYGLLKIFLKEAIGKRQTEGKLICSYFLKTAVFWEICNERTHWSAKTFLYCFWACFRRLIGWVNHGYCPNFFIPENNMFYGKIQGRAQSELLSELMALYSEGYKCVLRCPTLQPSFRPIILLRMKWKLQQPNAMYKWTLSKDKYRAAGGEHTPLTVMMKKVVVFTLSLPMDIGVPELTMEHQASAFKNVVQFPPLAIVNFLLYLSFYRQGQFTEADAVVEELAVLLSFDEEEHIHPLERAISWTMLGICQEMSGQLANAYHSYTEALHDQYNYFKDSTRVRIENVLMKMNSEYQ